MRKKWKITNCPASVTQHNLKAGVKSRETEFEREHKENMAMLLDLSGFLVIDATQGCHSLYEQKGQRWRTVLKSYLPQIVLQPLLELTEIYYCSDGVNKPGNISKTSPLPPPNSFICWGFFVELLFQFCQSHALPVWRMGDELINFFFHSNKKEEHQFEYVEEDHTAMSYISWETNLQFSYLSICISINV